MTAPNKIGVPRLPLWRLEMMREQAERRVDRARDAYDAATAELHDLLRTIGERRHEERARLLGRVEGAATPVAEEVDVRGWLVPNGPHGS